VSLCTNVFIFRTLDSSETSVNFYQTVGRNTSKDKLKYHKTFIRFVAIGNAVLSESHCALIKGVGSDVYELLYRPAPV
jgi:hypothetical protein